MNGKNLRIVGIVSSIIGFIITAFGVYKYEEAKGMVKALGQGSALFGSTDSTYRSEAIWLSSMNNYRIVITIVDEDEDSEVLDYITDYHHLLLHYERLSGADIGECKKCGALFRQQYRNKYKYCEEHRIKAKKQKNSTVRQCYECGTFFDVPVRGNTSKMFFCRSCQEKANKAKKIAWMKNKRKCVETK